MSITLTGPVGAMTDIDRARARSIAAARVEAALEAINRRDPTPQHEADLREARLNRRDALQMLALAEAQAMDLRLAS